MKPDAYMPYDGAKFEQATKGYDVHVKWGYLCALWHNWGHLHCQGLPDDEAYLRNVCECLVGDWARVRGVIFGSSDEFFTLSGGRWHQKAQLERFQKVTTDYNAQLTASRLGVEARRAKGQLPAVALLDEPAVEPADSLLENQNKNKTVAIPLTQARAREGHPVELPPGFPQTEGEAKAAVGPIGCPEQFAVDTWTQTMGRGGVDAKGQPVRSWAHYLAACWKFNQNREAKDKTYASNHQDSQQHPDRNKGTTNEGRAHQYAGLGRVAKAGPAPGAGA